MILSFLHVSMLLRYPMLIIDQHCLSNADYSYYKTLAEPLEINKYKYYKIKKLLSVSLNKMKDESIEL